MYVGHLIRLDGSAPKCPVGIPLGEGKTYLFDFTSVF